ncbi:MAG TPA: hypothetical protein PK379_10310 [Candidatus Hydrogenedentes bacterium]|nr:hypothetical protein [Candidatus Hydrogenedentota bacterium]HOJ68294.1 hypothetical protein [Candidatus Hydrogenedentota bacterium]HOK90406.1 hypothetical protein [Candidatus Hydrogenedentota bacterium]HOV61225.1 hypothetical protein [Candidatus Hydrogenedentota bacterium]
MDGITAISGTSMKAAEIAAAYDAKVIALQKDTVRMQGEMAVKLIQAATTSPPVANGMDSGRILNVTV